MNWEAIGAIGEVGGAFAVVITLLFLAKQLRDNTKSTNAAAAGSYMQAYSAANATVADPVRARISRLGFAEPDKLSEDEAQAFFGIMSQFLALWESMFYMHQHGTIPEPHWQVGRHDMMTVANTVGGKRFFEEMLDFYDKSFPEFANEIRTCLAGEQLYEMSKWAREGRGLDSTDA